MKYTSLICALTCLSRMSYCVYRHGDFNPNYTGVHFTPFVKHPFSIFSSHQYDLEEVKVMLSVISTKFSRIMTCVDSDGSEESSNKSGFVSLITAEAAAWINLDHNITRLQVFICIKISDDAVQSEETTAEKIAMALKASDIANNIFPRTVVGIQISNVLSTPKSVKKGVLWITSLKNYTMRNRLTIGIQAQQKEVSELITAYKMLRENDPTIQLLKMSDFLTLEFHVNAIQDFSNFGQLFLLYRGLLKSINKDIIMVGSTGWPKTEQASFEDIQKMKEYWIEMNSFATKSEFFMWLDEAIENPWKSQSNKTTYHAWWRLTNNDFSRSPSGYVERITESQDVPSGSDENSSGDMWKWIGIGIAILGLVLLLIFSLWIRMCRRVTSLKTILTKEEIDEFKHGAKGKGSCNDGNDSLNCVLALTKPYDRDLEISLDMLDIHWTELLGSGQFGCVYKAILKQPLRIEVALKTTKKDCQASGLKGILSEIKILSHIGNHPNIVSICGACTSGLANGKVYLATEFCNMGSLKTHLINLTVSTTESPNDYYANVSDPKADMLRWSYEIAKGMEHLGSKNVIHADLATRNVLLSRNFTAKISDFGLSRRTYDYMEYSKKGKEPLPWKWMAIESLKYFTFSPQSDVWSYGVTVWEIFSHGAEPYPGLAWTMDFAENLEGGLRLKRPHLAPPELYEIMLDCWHTDPGKRPNFNDLQTGLLGIGLRNK